MIRLITPPSRLETCLEGAKEGGLNIFLAKKTSYEATVKCLKNFIIFLHIPLLLFSSSGLSECCGPAVCLRMKENGRIVMEHGHEHPPRSDHERGHTGARHVDWRQAINLIFCAGGILVCYLWFGIVQESM